MIIDAVSWIALMVIPIQIVLCLKCKRKFWKFLPAGISAAAAIYCYMMSYLTTEDGWISVSYFMIAVLSLIPLAASGIGCVLVWLWNTYGRHKAD